MLYIYVYIGMYICVYETWKRARRTPKTQSGARQPSFRPLAPRAIYVYIYIISIYIYIYKMHIHLFIYIYICM